MDKNKGRPKKREQEWEGSYRSRRSPARVSARRRKLRTWLLYSLMAISVLGVGIALSLTVLFKIDTIEVIGETRYAPEQIIALSGVEKGQNLFLCKTKEGSDAIEHAMPYIESVDITRTLPSKIAIHITEAVPVGLVEYEGRYAVTSSSGKVLEFIDTPIDSLPIIKGMKISSAEEGSRMEYVDESVQDILENITQAITLTGMQDIKEIDLSSPTNPKLNYQNRIIIKLGQPIDLIIKLRNAMAALQPGHIEVYEKGTLDLSLTAEDGRTFFNPDYSSSQSASSGEPSSSQEPSSEPSSEAAVSSQDPQTSSAEDPLSSQSETGDTQGGGASGQ